MLLVVYNNCVGHEAVRSETLDIHVSLDIANTLQAWEGGARVLLRR
jgi:hypothetical protein